MEKRWPKLRPRARAPGPVSSAHLSANGQLTPPAPPPQLCQRQQLSTRLHFKPLAMIASFESTASLCSYDIGILPTYLQKPHAHVPCVALRKTCEEKSETVSRAHGIDQNNRNFIDEGHCSIPHLVASNWEGVGFTFQCGLIGLLADSSDQSSRCFGKCVPATPRGPSMRLDATNSHYTCFRPKFLMIPTKFASESACLDLHSLASLTSRIHKSQNPHKMFI